VIVHGIETHRIGKVKIAAWDYPPVPNDICEDPYRLDSVPFVSSTNYAEKDLKCGVEGRGRWHLFTGTGRVTTISTDHPETDYETELLVVTDCDDSEPGNCLASVDPGIHAQPIDNAFGKKFTIDTEKDQRYRVMVYGSNPDDTGTYGLSVTDYIPPANDRCSNADSLTVDGPAVEGTTEFATVEGLGDCATTQQAESRGVWYSFRGTGKSWCGSTQIFYNIR